MVQEDGYRTRPTFDSEEKQRIQRANQIFLRLKTLLHDRDGELAERDVNEAAQGARWLWEIVERYSDNLEEAYEDALAASKLPEEDRAYLQKRTEEAGGFSSFVRRDLRRLEESAPDGEEHPGDPVASMTRRPYVQHRGRTGGGRHDDGERLLFRLRGRHVSKIRVLIEPASCGAGCCQKNREAPASSCSWSLCLNGSLRRVYA